MDKAIHGWHLLRTQVWGAWVAQCVEHAVLNLSVPNSSPTLDVDITFKKKKNQTVAYFLTFHDAF